MKQGPAKTNKRKAAAHQDPRPLPPGAGQGPCPAQTLPATEEIQAALRPLASLISKSEKAQTKLAPGTWQHAMLRDNLAALRLAMARLNAPTAARARVAPPKRQAALRALAAMIARTAKSQAKFPPGTSQHTLQRNRLRALRIAEAALQAARD